MDQSRAVPRSHDELLWRTRHSQSHLPHGPDPNARGSLTNTINVIFNVTIYTPRSDFSSLALLLPSLNGVSKLKSRISVIAPLLYIIGGRNLPTAPL